MEVGVVLCSYLSRVTIAVTVGKTGISRPHRPHDSHVTLNRDVIESDPLT